MDPTQNNNIVASGFTLFIKKRAIEVIGLGIIALSALVALTLVTYNPTDPSFNSATNIPPTNKLGIAGAFVADALIQWGGIASYLIIPTFLIWGLHILIRHEIHFFKTRAVAFILGSCFLSASLAPYSLPMDTWFGTTPEGVIGKVLFQNGLSLSTLFNAPQIINVLIFLILGLGLILFSWNVPLKVWKVVANLMKTTVYWPIQAFAKLLQNRKKPESLLAPEITSSKSDVITEESLEKTPASLPIKQSIGKKVTNHTITKSDFGQQVGNYTFPSTRLLQEGTPFNEKITAQSQTLKESGEMLKATLDDFGIKGEITSIKPGPVVTLYEFKPAPGTKSSRVISLSDDIARSMSAVSARISVIPGNNAIGIELPNAKRQTVYMRPMLENKSYVQTGSKLPLALGRDIGGTPVIADITKMPHLLVAGTTGSGKSVSVNTMILSLIYHLTPDECKFIMIDPKMLELSVYDGIPHLLTPVVTDPHKAVMALKWAVREMESRYQSMSRIGVRNIDGYNNKIVEAKEKGQKITRSIQTGFDTETGQPVYEEQELPLERMPYIVVIVDEMADLMLVAGKDIEGAVQRLAQMARAAGIHLIMATQRPSVDVITGTIKANFPTRISFSVTSKIDSRTILGEQGAEQLLGQGDMLYMAPGGRITRVHGPFVADDEVERLVHFLKSQGEPKYETSVISEENNDFGSLLGTGEGSDSGDALYDQALALILKERKASTSFIQRCLQIGYNRAARIMDRMEKEGVVSPANHVGKREILINSQE
jgi:S-DNA-T family DNA segregation ATPase FtsK/SpoIIIE